ncbi:MAG: hypothetical protein II984_06755 [Clostridia bacterium]|nr:hypothetical protein [Clostridia bacterium]
MKKVIRKSVFETNSSSTHSLTLKKTKSGKIDKEASFEIRSPLAKAITMLGLIDNAEDEYKKEFYVKDEYFDGADELKASAFKKLEKIAPKMVEGLNIDEISSYELAEILNQLDGLESFYNEEDFENIDEYIEKNCDFEYYFYDAIQERRQMLKVHSLIFEEYAKIVNKPYDEAKEEIDFEAFAYVELKNALADKENAKEKVEKLMNRDYRIKLAYSESEEKDLLKVAEKFLYDNYLEFKNAPGRRYCCHRYFCDGALDDCNCGFETYTDICNNLDITDKDDESVLREKVRKYLSDEYKLVAKESYGFSGRYYKSGDIY